MPSDGMICGRVAASPLAFKFRARRLEIYFAQVSVELRVARRQTGSALFRKRGIVGLLKTATVPVGRLETDSKRFKSSSIMVREKLPPVAAARVRSVQCE